MDAVYDLRVSMFYADTLPGLRAAFGIFVPSAPGRRAGTIASEEMRPLALRGAGVGLATTVMSRAIHRSDSDIRADGARGGTYDPGGARGGGDVQRTLRCC